MKIKSKFIEIALRIVIAALSGIFKQVQLSPR